MVTILLQSESHYPVNRKSIRDAVIATLETRIKRHVEVSISVIGDRMMRKLNRSYRDKDYATDVLSFPLSESSAPTTPFVSAPDDILRLGDIVVSYPQAVREAAESSRFVDEVMVELVLHGLDHLLGIHHPE